MKSSLSDISPELFQRALTVREAFLDELENLPKPLSSVLTKQYRKRIERAHGKPLLGEYAPWLLADVLSIKEHEIVSKLALPWLCLYAYTYFIDDFIDQPETTISPSLLAASGVLLSNGLSSLYQLFFGKKETVKLFADECIQVALAVVKEVESHKGQFRKFTESDLADIGRKASMLRLCAGCLLIGDGVDDRRADEFDWIHRLGTGMQLMDDIGDWEEDWSQQNYTYPLTLAMLRLQDEKVLTNTIMVSKLNSDCVLAALIVTGAIEETLDIIVESIRNVITSPTMRHGSVGFRFLQNVLQDCLWLKNETINARRICAEEKLLCLDSDWLNELVQRERASRCIRSIHDNIRIVAQNS